MNAPILVSREKTRWRQETQLCNQHLSRSFVMQRWRARVITADATAAVTNAGGKATGLKWRQGGDGKWPKRRASLSVLFQTEWCWLVTVLALQWVGRHYHTTLKYTDTHCGLILSFTHSRSPLRQTEPH